MKRKCCTSCMMPDTCNDVRASLFNDHGEPHDLVHDLCRERGSSGSQGEEGLEYPPASSFRQGFTLNLSWPLPVSCNGRCDVRFPSAARAQTAPTADRNCLAARDGGNRGQQCHGSAHCRRLLRCQMPEWTTTRRQQHRLRKQPNQHQDAAGPHKVIRYATGHPGPPPRPSPPISYPVFSARALQENQRREPGLDHSSLDIGARGQPSCPFRPVAHLLCTLSLLCRPHPSRSSRVPIRSRPGSCPFNVRHLPGAATQLSARRPSPEHVPFYRGEPSMQPITPAGAGKEVGGGDKCGRGSHATGYTFAERQNVPPPAGGDPVLPPANATDRQRREERPKRQHTTKQKAHAANAAARHGRQQCVAQ